MKLKHIKRILKKIDKGYCAIGEYNYKYYSIDINDIKEDIDKKYILNICTMRCIILQSIFFDEATEIVNQLEGIDLNVQKG